MPKLRVTLGIGIANARQEDVLDIDEDEWAACETEAAREKLMNDYWDDWSSNLIDGGSELVNEGDL